MGYDFWDVVLFYAAPHLVIAAVVVTASLVRFLDE